MEKPRKKVRHIHEPRTQLNTHGKKKSAQHQLLFRKNPLREVTLKEG